MNRSTLIRKAVQVGSLVLGAAWLSSCAPVPYGAASHSPHPVVTRSPPPGCGVASCRFPGIAILPGIAVVLASPPGVAVGTRVIATRGPRPEDEGHQPVFEGCFAGKGRAQRALGWPVN